ncbi:Gldg family protein [Sphingopyxis panaciterrulae]|uniref:ABC-type uncharacterized transport system domain-containing protein n=1 Tax=Sphingopyxis panaciterrulae TaxID=462372 RepID=A0A7W9B6N5_9SPHN|nr:hypothetical protein [Sphingopyxis panaciterrulae]
MTAWVRPAAVAALAVALAWVAGGQAVLGRIDPALAFPLLMMPMLLLAGWQRREDVPARRRAAAAALLLLAVLQGALAWALADSVAWGQLAFVFGGGAVAALTADWLVRRRGRAVRCLLGIAALLGWFVGGHLLLATLYRPAATARPAAVTMLTSLPLRWAQGDDMAAMIAQGADEDPALLRLEAAGPVQLVDSLADHVPPSGAALLLAHPPALAPRDLVAVDAFVRGGGRAVILADPLSGWPARHPLGDPRNPPVTSLLTPLLDHWGVTLGAAPLGERGARDFDVAGGRLRLFSAGRFESLPPGCRAFAGARIAHCRIGAGEAWLVGDADLLFAPLWQPLLPGAAHLRRADTMEWLDARLRGGGAGAAWFRPLWIGAA